jgi:hypothetical protein
MALTAFRRSGAAAFFCDDEHVFLFQECAFDVRGMPQKSFFPENLYFRNYDTKK